MTQNNKYLEEFSDAGYIILRDFFPKSDIDYFRASITSYIKHLMKLEGFEISGDPVHEGFMLLDQKRQDKNNVDRIHELYNMVRRSDALNRMTYNTDLMDIVKGLIGLNSEEILYMRTQFCRMDPPHNSNHLLNWHQESYISLPNTRSAQLWAPGIERNWAGNGSMTILKYSPRGGEVPHYIEQVSPVYITHGVPRDKIERYSEYEEVVVDMNAGDALLFHPHLLHRSNSNNGTKVRYSLIAHYINPYDSGFHLKDDAVVTRYHQSRCVNANEFKAFIDAPKQALY